MGRLKYSQGRRWGLMVCPEPDSVESFARCSFGLHDSKDVPLTPQLVTRRGGSCGKICVCTSPLARAGASGPVRPQVPPKLVLSHS